MKIPIDKILPNPDNPRLSFDQGELQELADSVRELGLINPVAVEAAQDGAYILVDGERRWRACRLVGLSEIEAHVLPSKDGSAERLVKALIANLQRADLSPVEEGKAYRNLTEMGMTYTRIAHQMSVSLPTVMGRLKLTELDPQVQALVDAGKLPTDMRVTAALLSLPRPAEQLRMARRLARPGIRIKTIEAACENYKRILTRPDGRLENPALELAQRKRSKVKAMPAWSILHQLGQLPRWSDVALAANETCRNCALYDFASSATCRDCPAVELVRTLLEMADERR